MNVVVLTGAGISAESGVPTFRDADGLWEGHRVEDVATPEAYDVQPERGPPLLRRPPHGARPGRAQPGAPRPGAARGGARRRPAGDHPEHRRPARARRARPACCTCTASSGRRSAAPARGGTPWTGDLGDFPPCPGCGVTELRPDVVWFGEMPYEMDRIFAALDAGRPVRRDRDVGRGLPGRGVRAVRVGHRRAHPRAQPRAQ